MTAGNSPPFSRKRTCIPPSLMLYAVLAEDVCRASSESSWTRQLYPIKSDRVELGLILVPPCPIFPRAADIVFLLFPLPAPVCFVPFCRLLVGDCPYRLMCFGDFFFPFSSRPRLSFPFCPVRKLARLYLKLVSLSVGA